MKGSSIYTVAEARAAGILPAAQPKAQDRPIQHERELAIALAEWLRLMRSLGRLRALVFHVGNERSSRQESILAWRMGVEAGVPDLIVCMPGGQGGAIELKRPDGKGQLSKEQRQWRDELRAMGWQWAMALSIEDVEATLTKWGVLS